LRGEKNTQDLHECQTSHGPDSTTKPLKTSHKISVKRRLSRDLLAAYISTAENRRSPTKKINSGRPVATTAVDWHVKTWLLFCSRNDYDDGR